MAGKIIYVSKKVNQMLVSVRDDHGFNQKYVFMMVTKIRKACSFLIMYRQGIQIPFVINGRLTRNNHNTRVY